jgi:hypothetical protein
MTFKIQKSVDDLDGIWEFMENNLEAKLKDDKLTIAIDENIKTDNVMKDILCDISLFQIIIRRAEEQNNKEIHHDKNM